MRIVIAGSSGFIGTALTEYLRSHDHEVLRLVRRPAVAQSEVQWDPTNGSIDTEKLAGVDVMINLAGAGVGDHRWTARYKQQILNSRVQSTQTLVAAALELKPKVLINASAIGWYGDTGEAEVDETSPNGTGFLADVVRQWEDATKPASDAGIRVVLPRTGLVMATRGGAWARMVPLFKFGLGGRFGTGRQYWSYITMADELAAIEFVMNNESISGPVNVTAPTPVTNREMTKAMSKAFRRPAFFHVPAIALKIVLGEFSSEILHSARVLPRKLMEAGFTFQHPDVDSAARTLLS